MKSFEGLEKGEHKQALESARKMLMKGYNKADVSDITGLSIEEIENLKMV
ncbi:putative transposase/invertase (TIGR01784 family) [Sphingobacterium zeae]|uniref:Transposase/invertase (TIGR01784 family) n=1 Tax=Sphingobacterium zeae TaxID=1776859 RepID=A0ABU0TZD0_9SPHI|nr:putative transposase/invertase (TIGR01784 family) [Sphingobacterium zeae]